MFICVLNAKEVVGKGNGFKAAGQRLICLRERVTYWVNSVTQFADSFISQVGSEDYLLECRLLKWLGATQRAYGW